jgi:hypothetical protein
MKKAGEKSKASQVRDALDSSGAPMPPKSNVVSIPTAAMATPERLLEEAVGMAKAGDLTEVLVIGYDADDRLTIMSSGGVLNKDALWMLEAAKGLVMGDAE